jgi:ketosteroid isomerase-like protein
MTYFIVVIAALLTFPGGPYVQHESDLAKQVLAQESRWLAAVASRDRTALSSVLDDDFVHVNYLGQQERKASMLARIASGVEFSERTGQQSVTILGPTAIVHGVNTVSESGRTVLRLRYTDVYVLRGSEWRAISAQETAIRAL